MWDDAIAGPRTARYRQMLRDAVPAAYSEGAGDTPQSVWLWRTLRTVEAAGLDAREVLQAAVDSRPLAGAGMSPPSSTAGSASRPTSST